MYEAIITVTVPEENGEPAHTKVYRVEFEGEAGIVGEDNGTDTFQLTRVVNSECLTA